MKKKIMKQARQLSAEEVWQQLTRGTRQHLTESQKITNPAELKEVMEKLRSQGLADVSRLLINSGRGVKVRISKSHYEVSDQEGILHGLFINGSTDPFLWLEIGIRSKAIHSFISSKNKIVKIEDEKDNILYDNSQGGE